MTPPTMEMAGDSGPSRGVQDTARSPLWGSLLLLAIAAALLLPATRTLWFSLSGARWAYILLLAFLISFGLTPIVARIASRLGILDMPASRKVHATPTPLLGGVAIYVAVSVAILAEVNLDRQIAAILIGGTLLVVVGVLDDIFQLPAAVKLVAQLLAAGIVLGSGVVLTLFPWLRLGSLLDALLTVVWLLGITNAMNFFDGMDGLATGLGIITAGFLGLFAYLTFQPLMGWLAAALVGGCLGYLPFNFRRKAPAAIFLGDAGSTFLGFVLAALAVRGDWAESHLVDIAAPVLIFWVFIYDMTYITAARILTGKVRSLHDWIAYVGRDHLHHRLEALLGNKRQAVLLVFAFSICMGLAAIALVHSRGFEAAPLILQAVLIAGIFSILEQAGHR
jgi:UDP-GlcNAc:undecaprenyl-phosphate/decaprenyl-phosphate GlcNAc-1-phosphate transferase